jgi:hypothetical protein
VEGKACVCPSVCLPLAGAVDELLEELSDALLHLARACNARVVRLCSAPEPLALWALELLKDQAIKALLFMRDLEHSPLRRGLGFAAFGL